MTEVSGVPGPSDPGDRVVTDEVSEAEARIAAMPWDEFIGFQTELQYAAIRQGIRRQVAGSHMMSCHEAEHYAEGAIPATLLDPEGITNSELYEAARKRLLGEGLAAEENWTGWIGLTQEQVDSIKNSIETVAQHDMPSRIVFAKNPTEEDAQAAEQVILEFGINGLFVDCGNSADLLAAFSKNWGAQTQ